MFKVKFADGPLTGAEAEFSVFPPELIVGVSPHPELKPGDLYFGGTRYVYELQLQPPGDDVFYIYLARIDPEATEWKRAAPIR